MNVLWEVGNLNLGGVLLWANLNLGGALLWANLNLGCDLVPVSRLLKSPRLQSLLSRGLMPVLFCCKAFLSRLRLNGLEHGGFQVGVCFPGGCLPLGIDISLALLADGADLGLHGCPLLFHVL